MNFDVRSYCERLAKAAPERIELMIFGEPERAWGVRDRKMFKSCFCDSGEYEFWAFIGPLADELGVKCVCTYRRGESRATLLEAVFAACCGKLESAKP